MTDLADMYADAAAKTAPPTALLAIDPGNLHSAFVLLDIPTRRPLEHGKIPNPEVLTLVGRLAGASLAIEMIASYGMPVGREVFDTCVWIGRYAQRYRDTHHSDLHARLIYRRDIKLHHCGTAKAKDANITQALVDRFAPGAPNRGKGTKADPGWFYGFAADVWQAYALGVYAIDSDPFAPPAVAVPDAQGVLL